MEPQQIVFELSVKETLNQNRLPHRFQAGKIIKTLRESAQKIGIERHPEKERASQKLESLMREEKLSSERSRIQKQKKKKDLSDDQIEELLSDAEKELKPEIPSSDILVSYLYEYYKVSVTVFSLTRGRMDPPNFYPTIKPIVDGLTDASWWPDDSFLFMTEMSFKYGGVTPTKGKYIFVIDIEESDESEIESHQTIIKGE